MNKKIKYIAFYTHNYLEKENRIHILSATNKIDYICSALKKNGYDVEIISPSWTNNTTGYYKGNVNKIAEGITIRTFGTFGAKNKIQRLNKYVFSLFQLFIHLIFNVTKEEPIIVYHSVILSLPIRVAKFFKKFKLILEVEEIYQDIQAVSKPVKINEYKILQTADKYIFPTELLNKKLNNKGKPHAIIYGTYKIEEERKNTFNDSKIHIVYAGTFDPRKGGALAAVDTVEYLPKNYHVHIIGFGSEKDISLILGRIKKISKISDATISYDGLLKGEEYISFLQKCDIGLSTQRPDAMYNETSFPSKILSYMSNGLRVVSVRIKAVEISAIGTEVYYYDEQSPKAIAEAIKLIDVNQNYNSIVLIEELNKKFIININKVLNS